MKSKDWLTIAFVAVGGYLVYRVWGGLKSITDPVSNVIADTYVKLTQPGAVKIYGSLILPNGSSIKWQDLVKRSDYRQSFDDATNEMIVTFGGKTYRVYKRDENGNYLTR